jgi:hypothetical protein
MLGRRLMNPALDSPLPNPPSSTSSSLPNPAPDQHSSLNCEEKIPLRRRSGLADEGSFFHISSNCLAAGLFEPGEFVRGDPVVLFAVAGLL